MDDACASGAAADGAVNQASICRLAMIVTGRTAGMSKEDGHELRDLKYEDHNHQQTGAIRSEKLILDQCLQKFNTVTWFCESGIDGLYICKYFEVRSIHMHINIVLSL